LWYGVSLDTANDLLLTSDILNHLESEYFIDITRIYATGKSDGAGFCNVLACDPVLSNRFAAFAPVSGAFYSKNTSTCVPATVAITCNPGRSKIPMLEFHGGKDSTIPYVGEGRKEECLPSIPHWAQSWAARDGLSLTNQTTDMKGTNDTFIYQFGSGLEFGLVTQIFDKSIAHDWPSTVSNSYVSLACADVSGAECRQYCGGTCASLLQYHSDHPGLLQVV
jgi:poly(3-hydroxybutyrate) depolymerase